MAEYKVSIILPVYNVEKYLRECMESLVNQTLQGIEIVAVNDGSPDNSIDILNEYKEKYPEMVKVYTTENRGVSHARNFGLEHSNGEYILFVDSDDYVELNMCELLYNKAVKDGNDLVLCNRYDIVTSESGKAERKEINVLPLNQNFKLSERKFELIKISPFPWDKLFKKSTLKDRCFVENLRFEDLLFVHTLLPELESIGVVNAPLYNYRRTNTGGFLNTFTEATLDIIRVFEMLAKYYKEQGIFGDYKDELEYLCVRHFYFRYLNFFKQAKNNGELKLKIKLIDKSVEYLNREYPEWQKNHYLKYSARKDLTDNYRFYFNRRKMGRYVKMKHYLPGSVIKCVEKTYMISVFMNKLRKALEKQTMGQLLSKKVKRLQLWKLFNLPVTYRYTKFYEKMSVDEKFILFESKHGEDLAGNIFRMILSATREKYEDYRVALVANSLNSGKITEWFDVYGINNVELIIQGTNEYYKALASAKYLITDTSFPPYYIKKDEQIYLNTWHGTPLKYMGRIVPEREYGLGNVQRNFFIADYLLYQQEFSKNIFFEDYMLDELFDGEVLLSGYPRNSAFYMKNRYEEIREELGVSDKQISIYMPTWRGTLNKKENEKQVQEIKEYLNQIDMKLKDNQIMYVKLHTFVQSSLDYSEFGHIRPFPVKYETYDFLNASDLLITDYSSILFDYACSKKKIILFTYDRDEYLSGRGIYIDFDKLPFPACNTVEELVEELSLENKGYEEFYNEFCCYDSIHTVDDVLDKVVDGRSKTIKTISYNAAEADNTLVYVDNFVNGAGAETIIPALNRYGETRQFYAAFKGHKMRKRTALLSKLSKKVGYLPLGKEKDMLLGEKISFILYTKFNINPVQNIRKLNAFADREIKRRFGNAVFKNVIIHSCMDRAMIKTLASIQADKKIYCFSIFDEEKYKSSGKYKTHIKQILMNLSDVKTVYIPENMKAIADLSVLAADTKIVVFDPQTFDVSKLIEEVC